MGETQNKILVWIIVGVFVVAGVVFYYYETPTKKPGTFEFLSGTVAAKDIMNKTITVRADWDQQIPAGTQKTFLISDGVFIQKIFSSEPSRPGAEARFENSAFEEIKTGDRVTIQGEFSTVAAKKEEKVFAVSIAAGAPLENGSMTIVGEAPNFLSSSFSGIIIRRGSDHIIVRSSGVKADSFEDESLRNKVISSGTERKVFITGETEITKSALTAGNGTFEDLNVGTQIAVDGKNFVNILKQKSFEAERIVIFSE